MRNPCRRDCPDRMPGCNCEKRKAWKFQQAQIRDAIRRERSVVIFIRDCQRRIARRYHSPREK